MLSHWMPSTHGRIWDDTEHEDRARLGEGEHVVPDEGVQGKGHGHGADEETAIHEAVRLYAAKLVQQNLLTITTVETLIIFITHTFNMLYPIQGCNYDFIIGCVKFRPVTNQLVIYATMRSSSTKWRIRWRHNYCLHHCVQNGRQTVQLF